MSLKKIKVNPIFLASSGGGGGGGSRANKSRKEKPSGVSLGQSNTIKKKLIARIKNFQQNGDTKPQSNISIATDDTLNDVFGNSVQFLDNLAREREEKKQLHKRKTLKNKQPPNPIAQMQIETELPPELEWDTIAPPPLPAASFTAPVSAAPVSTAPVTSAHVTSAPVSTAHVSNEWNSPPPPSYSNLKSGGSKPTYRTWHRMTQKIKNPPITIVENNKVANTPAFATSFAPAHATHASFAPTSFAPAHATNATSSATSSATSFAPAPATNATSSATHATSSDAPEPPTIISVPYAPSLAPKRKRITRTLKYKLGKHANGKVSVLIKNSQTRRKVQTEHSLLKQKSILDIKNDLRSKNLLKVGSSAPNDVLRHLYEQSILAGQIENKSKDTLIHNYFSKEKE